MADERVVAHKLEQIEQYHGELRTKQRSLSQKDLLTDTTEQRAVERMFEIAIQACGDLALHVATRDFGYEGDEAKAAVRVLGEEGVIDAETVTTLIAAIGFRNILGYEYGRIDHAEVYELLQDGLEVYDRFSRQLARWIQDQE